MFRFTRERALGRFWRGARERACLCVDAKWGVCVTPVCSGRGAGCAPLARAELSRQRLCGPRRLGTGFASSPVEPREAALFSVRRMQLGKLRGKVCKYFLKASFTCSPSKGRKGVHSSSLPPATRKWNRIDAQGGHPALRDPCDLHNLRGGFNGVISVDCRGYQNQFSLQIRHQNTFLIP